MDTQKIILNVSQRLIQEKGYNGFSLQAVANETKIRKSSLFHHFPSKENLVASVLIRYRRWFKTWDEKTIHDDLSIWQKLNQFFEIYRYFRKDKSLLCPLTMLAAEYETLPVAVKDSIKELLKEIEVWLVRQLEQGIVKKELKENLDCKQLAEMIASTITGSLSFCRIDEDEARFERQLAMIVAQVKFYERADK
jgi:TetR/AcrR family transcriptional repressor of nem operon